MNTNTDTERDIPNRCGRTILIASGLLLVIAVLSLGGIALLWDGGEQEGMILVIPPGSAATLD